MSDQPVYPDILGTETLPYGIKVGHTWPEIGVILRALLFFKVRTFVEIGIHEGGLASVLMPRTDMKPEFRYFGIEINPTLIHVQVRAMFDRHARADFVAGDCLDQGCVMTVNLNIGQRPALIYCDGGNKPAELLRYWPLLLPGDVIAAHDFYDPLRSYGGELLGYGRGLEFPLPEVNVADVAPLEAAGLRRVDIPGSETTRIVFLVRRG